MLEEVGLSRHLGFALFAPNYDLERDRIFDETGVYEHHPRKKSLINKKLSIVDRGILS